MKLKHEINEYRKALSAEMLSLQTKQLNGTANEFDLEQLAELTDEYQSILNNPNNYENT